MVNHPNRGKRLSWALLLPEIGEPLLEEIRRVKELERQAREARRAVEATIYNEWTPDEILAARRAANAGCRGEAF